jgi:hypothetical protein
MPKKVLLVGHCGPDGTYLRMAVKAAQSDVTIVMVDDPSTMMQSLDGADLVLFNRELGYGFEPETGPEMIAVVKKTHPDLKMMLISNYPEAQAEAVKAGALPGFGKREIGKPRVTELLRGALAI